LRIGLAGIGDDRADFGGGGKQRCRLGADDREIVVLGRFHVLGDGELQHFALGNHAGGGRENVERIERADIDHHAEGLAEQEVADQHACLVAPDHPRGGLAAAQSLSSTTSSCSSVAVCMNSTLVASLTWFSPCSRTARRRRASASDAGACRRRRSDGWPPRDHLTSEPAFERINWLTRSMSALVRSTNGLTDASLFLLSSSGMTTPNDPDSCSLIEFDNRKGRQKRQEAKLPRRGKLKGISRQMHELIRANDPVLLSFAQSLMKDAGIHCFIADQGMSILEGSLGMLPRRLLVDEDHADQARRILVDAGLGDELRTEVSDDRRHTC
jgi:hypothetical protein